MSHYRQPYQPPGRPRATKNQRRAIGCFFCVVALLLIGACGAVVDMLDGSDPVKPAPTATATPTTAEPSDTADEDEDEDRKRRKTPKASPEPSVRYDSCAEVRAAGDDPLYRGEEGYGRHLDRDGDGIACYTDPLDDDSSSSSSGGGDSDRNGSSSGGGGDVDMPGRWW